MPDVSRSDSQRSDSSRPRVSFNRDVHVKRIGTPGTPRVIGALTGDGEGHLVPLPVRRERPTRLSRRELAKEAKRVLEQADSVVCTSQALFDPGQKQSKNVVNSDRKFSTLPPLRRKSKKSYHNKSDHSLGEESPSSSLERLNTKSKKTSKRLLNIDSQNASKGSLASSLDRKSVTGSGKRNIVASVFSSLDRAVSKKNKHASADQDVDSFQNSNKNSSSLNDLVDNSSSSPVRTKKQRIGLQRSVSDAGSRKSNRNKVKNKSSNVFLSLDRLTTKQRRSKNKSPLIHSDHSDISPIRPRKNILKKSYSDSESASQTGVQEENLHIHGEGWKKKQLSPIIEVLPREDYFHEKKSTQPLQDLEKTNTGGREHTMPHSSQLPAQKPTLTRGHVVDAMVKRLSEDLSRTRGPPRGLNSASGLITPEHRQHNNNLPFSYTKPTTPQYGSSTPTMEPTQNFPLNVGQVSPAVDGQVIYAEVVVSGGGNNGGTVSKQTVHTKVLPVTETPICPKLRARQSEKTYFQQTSEAFPSKALTTDSSQPYHQQKEVRVKVTDEDEGLGLTVEHTSSDSRHSMDYLDGRRGVMDSYRNGNSFTSKAEFVQKQMRNDEERRDFLKNSSRRETRTDCSGKKEYILHESKYERECHTLEPLARGRADGMDFMASESYSGETWQHLENGARMVPADGHGHYGRDRRELLSRTVGSTDLSSRRDRLESRIESQRKDRLISNKYSDIGYKGSFLDTQNEINRKFATDIAFNNRRDFLNSQLDSRRSRMMNKESGKNYGVRNSQCFETSTKADGDSCNKKDLLADSGIEVDYRMKDSSVSNKKHEKVPIHSNKFSANSNHTQNVTRVDLHNHPYGHINDYDGEDDDDDDIEMDGNIHHYGDIHEHHKTKLTNTFTSTRLIQEQRHNEAIPSSTVLIRHWVPLNKEESNNLKNKYIQASEEKAENTQQLLLSDEEYEENDMSGRKDEYMKESIEEYRKTDNKGKGNEEKEDRKVTKKKQSSTIDKMKHLFMRSDKSAKKDKKKGGKVKVIAEEEEEEDPVTSRYTEYRGSDIDLQQENARTPHRDRINASAELEKSETAGLGHTARSEDQDAHHRGPSHHDTDPEPSRQGTKRGGQPPSVEEHKEPGSHCPVRQRLATPTPSPSLPRASNKPVSSTLTRIKNMKNKEQNSSGSGAGWFKSLDRLTKRARNKAKEQDKEMEIETEAGNKAVKQINNNNNNNNKNLRFFGDTDQESVTSTLNQPSLQTLRRYKSNYTTTTNGTSGGRLQTASRNLGATGLRHHRSAGDVATSSAESTTEGDSSQQSQRSVVYLHAATVGDIPGPPRSQHSGVARRARSREELSSMGGSPHPLQPQSRTVSRSISVLAPWKPRHYREGLEVHYDNDNSGNKTQGWNDRGKPPRVPVPQQSNGNITANCGNGGVNKYKMNGDRVNENHTALQKQRVNKATSTESLSQGQYSRDRTPSEKKSSVLNSSTSAESLIQRQNRDKSAAAQLSSSKNYRTATKKGREGSSAKLSRSASMPKDSRLTAGWFKLRKKKQAV